ncbi:MAG TPA: hypothetical protein VFD58_20535 [Blastocatellia bacterium]|nr:hypothetical protein [Blastocatellia bacterium]
MPKTVTQYLLLLSNALLLLSSQLLMKRGLRQCGVVTLNSIAQAQVFARQVLATPQLFSGILLAGCSALLWLTVLSRFELSYAMPVLSGIYYLMALVASVFILGEAASIWRITGTLLIVAGILLITRIG